MKKDFPLITPLINLTNKHTTGTPFIIWSAYGIFLTAFLIIFRNRSFFQFGNLVYVMVFSTSWFLVSDIVKKKEFFNKRLHFWVDSLVYLAIFSLIFYFTGGITGELFFIYSLVAISAPLFGSARDATALLVLAGMASIWVNVLLAYQGKVEFDRYHIGILLLIWLIYFAIAGIIKFFQANYMKELENARKYQASLVEKNKELEAAKKNVEDRIEEQTRKLWEQNDYLENTRKAVTNILEDVTESERDLGRKKFELEYEKKRSESILRFLKSIGDGVVATDMDGKIIFFNDTTEKLTGISSEEAMGKYAWDVMWYFKENDSKTQVKVVKKFLTGEERFNKASEHFMLRRKDGTAVNVSFSASFIYDDYKNKQGMILVVRDTEEERELERAKDNFLSVAAHQLRTPLSGIRWNLEMLLGGDMGRLPREAKKVIEDINENNLRLISLVNDLLNVSRINHGRSINSPKPVSVVETIQSAIKNINGLAEKNKIKIALDKVKNNGLKVLIIPRRFSESVENVISNAIKYSPVKGEVKISVAKKGEKVVIAIADSGIGIPKKDQAKIFSKFFRASNAAIKDPEGSGLGLNVVKSFIEEAGGSVYFESEEGKGTIFYLTLPICRNDKVQEIIPIK